MIEERERYERAFQKFQMTEPAWEILVDRRDRKRRNKRIAAGVVGIAVFVARLFDERCSIDPDAGRWRANRTGGRMAVPPSTRVFIGVPPEGAAPTRGREGGPRLEPFGWLVGD
jgi:hypothetical protein